MATAVIDPTIEMLLSSSEPVIRYRALLDLVGATKRDARVREAREAIPSGPIVRELLTERPDKHLVEVVDWMPDGRKTPSEPITLFALTLLKAARRLA